MPFKEGHPGRPSAFTTRLQDGAVFEEIGVVVLALLPEEGKPRSDWSVQIERRCCGKIETIRVKALRSRLTSVVHRPSMFPHMCRSCADAAKKDGTMRSAQSAKSAWRPTSAAWGARWSYYADGGNKP